MVGDQPQVVVIQEEEGAVASFCVHWLIMHKYSYLEQRRDLALPLSLMQSKALTTVMGLKYWYSCHG